MNKSNPIIDLWRACEENLMMLVPSALFSSFVSYLGTNGEVLLCWLVMSSVDCIGGIIVAITVKNFCTVKLFKWLGKVFIQLLIVFLLAMTSHVVNITIGIERFLSNWLLLFFILLDFSSFANKLLYFGLLPKPLEIILKALGHKFSKAFETMINTPGAAEELEKVLNLKTNNSTSDSSTPTNP